MLTLLIQFTPLKCLLNLFTIEAFHFRFSQASKVGCMLRREFPSDVRSGTVVGEIFLFVSLLLKCLLLSKFSCGSHKVGTMVASFHQRIFCPCHKLAEGSHEWSSGQVWYQLQMHCFGHKTGENYDVRFENWRPVERSRFCQDDPVYSVVYTYVVEQWTQSQSIQWLLTYVYNLQFWIRCCFLASDTALRNGLYDSPSLNYAIVVSKRGCSKGWPCMQ